MLPIFAGDGWAFCALSYKCAFLVGLLFQYDLLDLSTGIFELAFQLQVFLSEARNLFQCLLQLILQSLIF